MSAIFSLSVGLSNTFVNIYLWKVDKSYTAIGWYNLAMYVFVPAAFVASGWIANRRYSVSTLRIGIVLHACFYLLALIGGTVMARMPVFLGSVMGAAEGFYWYSFNFLSLRLTESNSRDRFYGQNGALVAVANMIAPVLSGILIAQEDRFGPFNGYHVMFAISLALFLLATLVTAKLRSEPISGQLSIVPGLKLVRQAPWRHLLLGCYIYGLREGVFLFLIGLLMYLATSSEVRLGEFLFLQNLLSFVAFYFAGKFLKPANRLTVLGTGAVAMAMASLLFLRPITTVVIVLYGVALALAFPVFIVPLQSMIFDTISALDKTGSQHDEQIIAREIAENGGRVTGIAAFLVITAISSSTRTVASFALVLGFVQVASWLVIRQGYQNRRGGGRRRGRGQQKEVLTWRNPSPS